MTLSQRSKDKLAGVDPGLVRIVEAASGYAAFHVTEGLRTKERQQQLLAAGKSSTMNSRHLTGHAVDLVAVVEGGAVSYADADMAKLGSAMKRAASECGSAIEWGGDWKKFPDSPHFQIPWTKKPPVEPPAPVPVPVPTADKPLSKSGTIWGALAALLATVVQYIEKTLGDLMSVIAQVATWGPLKEGLVQAGANVKAVGIGLGVSACMIVIARRVKAKQEGNPG